MHRLRTTLLALALGSLASVALASCTEEAPGASPSGAVDAVSPPADTGETVTIADAAFSVEALTVPAGTTVTWVNDDEMGHTVTHGEDGTPAPDALFDEAVNAGQSVTYTFEEPGTYPVTCTVHPEMQMTVTVES